MMYDFNADDVFEMAEQMEKNGYNFYETAAKGVSDEDAKKMLLEFAEMEKNHEKTFSDMRKWLGENEKEKTVFDPENEAVLYLRALADTRVFFRQENRCIEPRDNPQGRHPGGKGFHRLLSRDEGSGAGGQGQRLAR